MKLLSGISFLLALFILSSCMNERSSDPSSLELPVDKLHHTVVEPVTEPDSSIYLPSMLLIEGNMLNISYTSAGCFGCRKEKVYVKKKNNELYVACSTGYGFDDEEQKMSFKKCDLSFQNTLIAFGKDCKQLMAQNKKNSVDREIIYSTLNRWISINDGLHTVDIKLENENYLDPFYILTMWIKLYGGSDAGQVSLL